MPDHAQRAGRGRGAQGPSNNDGGRNGTGGSRIAGQHVSYGSSNSHAGPPINGISQRFSALYEDALQTLLTATAEGGVTSMAGALPPPPHVASIQTVSGRLITKAFVVSVEEIKKPKAEAQVYNQPQAQARDAGPSDSPMPERPRSPSSYDSRKDSSRPASTSYGDRRERDVRVHERAHPGACQSSTIGIHERANPVDSGQLRPSQPASQPSSREGRTHDIWTAHRERRPSDSTTWRDESRTFSASNADRERRSSDTSARRDDRRIPGAPTGERERKLSGPSAWGCHSRTPSASSADRGRGTSSSWRNGNSSSTWRDEQRPSNTSVADRWRGASRSKEENGRNYGTLTADRGRRSSLPIKNEGWRSYGTSVVNRGREISPPTRRQERATYSISTTDRRRGISPPFREEDRSDHYTSIVDRGRGGPTPMRRVGIPTLSTSTQSCTHKPVGDGRSKPSPSQTSFSVPSRKRKEQIHRQVDTPNAPPAKMRRVELGPIDTPTAPPPKMRKVELEHPAPANVRKADAAPFLPAIDTDKCARNYIQRQLDLRKYEAILSNPFSSIIFRNSEETTREGGPSPHVVPPSSTAQQPTQGVASSTPLSTQSACDSLTPMTFLSTRTASSAPVSRVPNLAATNHFSVKPGATSSTTAQDVFGAGGTSRRSSVMQELGPPISGSTISVAQRTSHAGLRATYLAQSGLPGPPTSSDAGLVSRPINSNRGEGSSVQSGNMSVTPSTTAAAPLVSGAFWNSSVLEEGLEATWKVLGSDKPQPEIPRGSRSGILAPGLARPETRNEQRNGPVRREDPRSRTSSGSSRSGALDPELARPSISGGLRNEAMVGQVPRPNTVDVSRNEPIVHHAVHPKAPSGARNTAVTRDNARPQASNSLRNAPVVRQAHHPEASNGARNPPAVHKNGRAAPAGPRNFAAVPQVARPKPADAARPRLTVSMAESTSGKAYLQAHSGSHYICHTVHEPQRPIASPKSFSVPMVMEAVPTTNSTARSAPSLPNERANAGSNPPNLAHPKQRVTFAPNKPGRQRPGTSVPYSCRPQKQKALPLSQVLAHSIQAAATTTASGQRPTAGPEKIHTIAPSAENVHKGVSNRSARPSRPGIMSTNSGWIVKDASPVATSSTSAKSNGLALDRLRNYSSPSSSSTSFLPSGLRDMSPPSDSESSAMPPGANGARTDQGSTSVKDVGRSEGAIASPQASSGDGVQPARSQERATSPSIAPAASNESMQVKSRTPAPKQGKHKQPPPGRKPVKGKTLPDELDDAVRVAARQMEEAYARQVQERLAPIQAVQLQCQEDLTDIALSARSVQRRANDLRLRFLELEEKRIKEGTHPDHDVRVKELVAAREAKLKVAANRLRLSIISFQTQFKAAEDIAAADFVTRRRTVRRKMLVYQAAQKQRLIANHNRSLVPNPVPTLALTPKQVYEKRLSRTVQAWESAPDWLQKRLSSSRKEILAGRMHIPAFPQGLEDHEIDQDLSFIRMLTAGSQSESSPGSQHFEPSTSSEIINISSTPEPMDIDTPSLPSDAINR
ncbi:uncharacterized protein EV422DRAFT_142005 [Fimicolochytrium jonesii]|uniref:uncharacterized protein n=1 Tax=Fimicolochytrium jonesii TaxID=1396493 RepID=UPI0022FEE31F|nr:uncharacterized protein EV422DRAFT_142005 [Fimicolochytrium jonesii]KAI8825813.1 hypothetical protein EV422DRAFT_142005 [Fimicolochytrium jonesii]